MATPVRSGYSDFGPKIEKSQKHAFFSWNWLFSWKNKIVECFTRIGRVFSTFQKILKINQKMATPVRSGYSDFGPNWKVPMKHAFFFKLIVFMKEQNFECFTRIGRVFSTFQKILKINQKMATPVRSGYSDFAENWKVPKTCFFFFKLIVFMKEQNFECFTRIGRVFSTFQKNTQNQTKKGPASNVRIQRFWSKNWKVPKTCFFFFKLIVFMKEQNFECFRRIGRVFSTFQKILKINQKMATPVRSGYGDFGPKIEKSQKHAFFSSNWLFSERTKFWMFHRNWKGIFNISKNTQNQLKNGHTGKVRIQRFWSKLKSPQNMPFFSSN